MGVKHIPAQCKFNKENMKMINKPVFLYIFCDDFVTTPDLLESYWLPGPASMFILN